VGILILFPHPSPFLDKVEILNFDAAVINLNQNLRQAKLERGTQELHFRIPLPSSNDSGYGTTPSDGNAPAAKRRKNTAQSLP